MDSEDSSASSEAFPELPEDFHQYFPPIPIHRRSLRLHLYRIPSFQQERRIARQLQNFFYWIIADQIVSLQWQEVQGGPVDRFDRYIDLGREIPRQLHQYEQYVPPPQANYLPEPEVQPRGEPIPQLEIVPQNELPLDKTLIY